MRIYASTIYIASFSGRSRANNIVLAKANAHYCAEAEMLLAWVALKKRLGCKSRKGIYASSGAAIFGVAAPRYSGRKLCSGRSVA